MLTLSGSEVEKIITPSKKLDKLVVGKVLECEKHPNAERLTVNKVQISEKPKKIVTIICGAPNVAVGQKVVVAFPGTELPNGAKIDKAKIRGIESNGMICSEDELGLGDDHTSIVVLDNNARVGSKAAGALMLSPAVFDIDVTPNRADCFSIIGLAREVAALTRKKLVLPKIKELPKFKKGKDISLIITDKIACTQYFACYLTDVTVGSSPMWLAAILREVGIKPINNLVDITNYVMFATGQPLHAFDADKLKGSKGDIAISVRRALKGEKMVLLDEKEHTLDVSNVVIADAKRPIAVAGVMGGLKSAVTDTTKEIVLEAAVFDPVITRKSAQNLGVRTESSARFEKGINANATKDAVKLAVGLYQELAGTRFSGYKEAPKFREKRLKNVELFYREFEDLIGVSISKKKIHDYLLWLGFGIKTISKEKLRVIVPDWRLDINIPADVIEEVARMYGLNNLPAANMRMEVKIPPSNKLCDATLLIKQFMRAQGFYELYSYSFYSDKERRGDFLSMFCDGRFNHLTVDNPLSPDQQFLRKSILPFIMKALAKNIVLLPDQQIKVFELGRIFIPQSKKLPEEALIIAGGVNFIKDKTESNLLYLKGVIDNLLSELGIKDKLKIGSFNERGVLFEHNNEVVAMAYVLREAERGIYKIKKPVGIFELSLNHLLNIKTGKKKYNPIVSYPAVTRDLALEFANDVLWKDIKKAVISPLLESMSFLSQYQLPNKKSVAFRLTFRAANRTLKAEEAEQEIGKIVQLLKNRFNARMRGKN